MDIYHIIKRPLVTEKGTHQSTQRHDATKWERARGGSYSFEVHPDASKPEIKQAIEKGLIAYETHRHLLPAPTEATGPIAGLLTGNVSEIPRDEEARARLEELRRSMEEAEKRRDAEQRAEQEEARRKIEDEKRRVREFVASKQGGDAA